MKRSDDEFKAEILKRSELYKKKERRNKIVVITISSFCVIGIFSFLYHKPLKEQPPFVYDPPLDLPTEEMQRNSIVSIELFTENDERIKYYTEKEKIDSINSFINSLDTHLTMINQSNDQPSYKIVFYDQNNQITIYKLTSNRLINETNKQEFLLNEDKLNQFYELFQLNQGG